MKTNIHTHTNGTGYWSREVGHVVITEVSIGYINDEKDFAELRAYFNPKDWDVNQVGLIYTDRQWMVEFRNGLVAAGFSRAAADDVDYSEQGMQGDNYVSMDVEETFIREWLAKSVDTSAVAAA